MVGWGDVMRAEVRKPSALAYASSFLDYDELKADIYKENEANDPRGGAAARAESFRRQLRRGIDALDAHVKRMRASLVRVLADLLRKAATVEASANSPELLELQKCGVDAGVVICELYRFVEVNQTACRKIAKKFDKRHPGLDSVRSWVHSQLRQATFCNTSLEPLLLMLSDCHAGLRARADASEGAGNEVWTPPVDFERTTTKYWVPMEHVPRLTAAVLRYLPVLIMGRRPPPAEEVSAPELALEAGGADVEYSQAVYSKFYHGTSVCGWISSLYLDSSDFSLYRERVAREDMATLFRMRWYGLEAAAAGKVYVERKTHRSRESGIKSSKERFAIDPDAVGALQSGAQQIDISGQLGAQVAAGTLSEKQRSKCLALSEEVAAAIKERALHPAVRTVYQRTAFQATHSNAVRLTLDSNLHLINEARELRAHSQDAACALDSGWCRSLAEPTEPQHHGLFPFAVLEVKLQDEAPPWIDELIESKLIVPMPKFSKYLTGCAVLHARKLDACDPPHVLPYWFEEPEVQQWLARFPASTEREFDSLSATYSLEPSWPPPLSHYLSPAYSPNEPPPPLEDGFVKGAPPSAKAAGRPPPDSRPPPPVDVFDAFLTKPTPAPTHEPCGTGLQRPRSFEDLEDPETPASRYSSSRALLNSGSLRAHPSERMTWLTGRSEPTLAGARSRGAFSQSTGASPVSCRNGSPHATAKCDRGAQSADRAQSSGGFRAGLLRRTRSFSNALGLRRDDSMAEDSKERAKSTSGALASLRRTPRMEPKTFFANERTFTSWLSASMLLLSVGIALTEFESARGGGQGGGNLIICSAMLIMFYGLGTFVVRIRKIKRKDPLGYDDQYGPVFLVLVLGTAITFYLFRLNGWRVWPAAAPTTAMTVSPSKEFEMGIVGAFFADETAALKTVARTFNASSAVAVVHTDLARFELVRKTELDTVDALISDAGRAKVRMSTRLTVQGAKRINTNFVPGQHGSTELALSVKGADLEQLASVPAGCAARYGAHCELKLEQNFYMDKVGPGEPPRQRSPLPLTDAQRSVKVTRLPPSTAVGSVGELKGFFALPAETPAGPFLVGVDDDEPIFATEERFVWEVTLPFELAVAPGLVLKAKLTTMYDTVREAVRPMAPPRDDSEFSFRIGGDLDSAGLEAALSMGAHRLYGDLREAPWVAQNAD